ncbi:MAG: glycosyl transferase family 4 [Mizugakiibacter sp.]|uniref:glycosyl transferase family 4 n=1 Tax=Mizugakiibacter sp. TaxID=1972610 RepID=UPI0031C47F27|nr:glycosyl transferase family 4 [Xanthomonadaceae bacterium]
MQQAAAILLACTAAFGVSALLVRASIAYAHRRGMLDHPGRRRSHAQPTPRGGGLGLVVGLLLGALPALRCLPGSVPPASVAALAAAVLMVAAIGWRDDHRPLAVLPRLAVHAFAALMAAAAVLWNVPQAPDAAPGARWLWLLAALPFAAWSINLHNFMDGIDGLLGLQAAFVGAGVAVLAYCRADPALTGAGLVTTAASLGFLLFNRPPARIFMGDVGSGALGLWLAALIGMTAARYPDLLWAGLILVSAFAVDATLTLLDRIARGRAWYTAHREHLYQWLVRSGRTHAQADRRYAAWNLLAVAPAAAAAAAFPRGAAAVCIGFYGLSGLAWMIGKRACIGRVRRREQHGLA